MQNQRLINYIIPNKCVIALGEVLKDGWGSMKTFFLFNWPKSFPLSNVGNEMPITL